MNTRALLVVVAGAMLGGALGWIVGWIVSEPDVWLVVGIAMGLPGGIYIVTKRRRWAAVALLNAEFVLSLWVGGPAGLLFAMTASGLTFIVSASILREFYGGSELEALKHHAKLAFGMTRGLQIVDASDTTSGKKQRVVLGPRLIIVKPGTAVTMERGKTLSRVVGPSMFTSDQYEYIKDAHNIRERQKTITCAGVTTHDMIPTTVTVSMTFGLDIGDDARRGERDLTADEERVLRRISIEVPDWEAETEAALQQAIRQTIGTYRSQDVLRGTRYPVLAGQIRHRVDHFTQARGVRVRNVILESVQPTSEISAAMDNRWAETARAAGMREALTLLADGYRRAQRAGMNAGQVALEVLRRSLEQMARDPATKFIMTSELAQFLQTPATRDEIANAVISRTPSDESSAPTTDGDPTWTPPSKPLRDSDMRVHDVSADDARIHTVTRDALQR